MTFGHPQFSTNVNKKNQFFYTLIMTAKGNISTFYYETITPAYLNQI